MAIYEIILCVVILLASVLVCAVTLSMDKADKNALGVINGLSGSQSNSMMKNSKDSNKNFANKLVAICTAVLLVIAIVMFVVNGIGG